jgi:hypothetical protein
MAKPNTTDTARAALLANLSRAVWVGITARDAQIAALRECESDEEQDDVKSIVLRTYMARRANPTAKEPTAAMLATAAKVLAMVGANSKEETRNKRTAEQEKWYTGARQYLFSLRKAAGVKAPAGTGGGANNTGPRAPRTPDGDTDKAPKAQAPRFNTGADLRAFAFQQAKMLAMLIEKPDNAPMVDPALRRAITAFAKATAGWAPTKE